ncbi:MAG: glycosyltransferase 87 family protein [bacterium]
MQRWALGVVVAVLIGASLGAGYAWKDRCSHTPWDNDWQYHNYCYNDILPLWFGGDEEREGKIRHMHDAQHDNIPFLQAWTEYPVGTAFFTYGVGLVTPVFDAAVGFVQVLVFLAVAAPAAALILRRADVPPRRIVAWVGGGCAGVLAIFAVAAYSSRADLHPGQRTNELLPYMEVTFMLLTGAAVVASWALWKLKLSPARMVFWAVAPPLVIHGLTNWDLLAVALAACGWWAWRSDRPFLAALLLGLGGSAKLYPAFFLPFLFLAAWKTKGWRATTPIVLGGAIGVVLPNALVAGVAWDNWSAMWMFQAHRAPDFETPWATAVQPFVHWLTPKYDNPDGWTAFAGYFGTAAMAATVAWMAHRVWRRGLDPLVAGGVLTLVFLLVNKVYSPQYTLWAFPILLAFGASWTPMVLFVAADAANFFVRYNYLSTIPPGVRDDWQPWHQSDWSHALVDLRWLFLAWATWSVLARCGAVRNPAWASRHRTTESAGTTAPVQQPPTATDR